MHGAAEGQIAAQADGQVGDTAEARLKRGQVGERLRRMADGHHVDVVGHRLQRVGDRLALGDGGELGAGETDHLAAEAQHGGFETQTRARARLIKQSGKHPAFAGVCHFFTMGIDVLRFVQHFLNLTNGKIIESDDAFSDHRRFDRRFEY